VELTLIGTASQKVGTDILTLIGILILGAVVLGIAWLVLGTAIGLPLHVAKNYPGAGLACFLGPAIVTFIIALAAQPSAGTAFLIALIVGVVGFFVLSLMFLKD